MTASAIALLVLIGCVVAAIAFTLVVVVAVDRSTARPPAQPTGRSNEGPADRTGDGPTGPSAGRDEGHDPEEERAQSAPSRQPQGGREGG